MSDVDLIRKALCNPTGSLVESSEALDTLAAELERVTAALRPLLKAAEDEVAEKVNSTVKGGAEYWAAQEIGASMPGVDRRIELARAVLNARAALAGGARAAQEDAGYPLCGCGHPHTGPGTVGVCGTFTCPCKTWHPPVRASQEDE
jgi:hypothetical protein